MHAAAGTNTIGMGPAIRLDLPGSVAGALHRDRILGPLLTPVGDGTVALVASSDASRVRERLAELGFRIGDAVPTRRATIDPPEEA